MNEINKSLLEKSGANESQEHTHGLAYTGAGTGDFIQAYVGDINKHAIATHMPDEVHSC